MKNFLKRNIVPVTGVALPIVMMIIFALATWIPAHLVAAPQYGLLYITNEYGGASDMFRVVNNEFVVHCNGSCQTSGYSSEPKLYRFDPATLTSTQIHVDYPKLPPQDNTAPMRNTETIPAKEFTIKELSGLKFVTTPTSPDGYALNTNDSYHNGLATELFYSRNHYRSPVITKNARNIELMQHTQEPYYYSYYNPIFLAWIATDTAKEPKP